MGDGSFRNLWGHPYWSVPIGMELKMNISKGIILTPKEKQ